ncbi:hypothetical protein A0H81_02092 [Grifola frondosa]|uniref:Uncharacterized protein n=1 Tax=Grifola frondosa TaxID=5627 RepID=A0A1C7MSW2_GRIFR|nr:hypothetical protein A0H81_02092 [Grifola frondosa]
MPCDFETLTAWIVVETAVEHEDGRHRTMVLYHPRLFNDDCGQRYEVVVRLQGFVEEVNIGPLGDWNGHEQGAPKAQQSLTLGHGGVRAPFEAQREGLNALRDVVLLSLNMEPADHVSSSPSIKLQRRVFSRVRPTGPTAVDSILQSGDDPLGCAAKIRSQWVVTHKISAGVQGADGKIRQCGHLVIRKGDFVDVAVFVEIFKRHTRKGVQLEMNLAMHDVVRLHSAHDLKGRAVQSVVRAASSSSYAGGIGLMSGVVFEGRSGRANGVSDADMEDMT